jgi:hypothetical protein
LFGEADRSPGQCPGMPDGGVLGSDPADVVRLDVCERCGVRCACEQVRGGYVEPIERADAFRVLVVKVVVCFRGVGDQGEALGQRDRAGAGTPVARRRRRLR